MDTVKNVIGNADIWKNKNYFVNRVKYIEGSLMKSSGKISREYLKPLVGKKVDLKVKWQKNMWK